MIFILATASATVAVVSVYYTFCVSKKPRIYAGNEKIRSFLESRVKMLEMKYKPSSLFWEGRLQTILGLTNRITNPHRFPYRREFFNLADGGQVALDFAEVEESTKNTAEKPMVAVFFPGLTSSSQACYVRTLVKTFNECGVSVVVFNNRGLGGVPFKTPRTYCAANCEDASEVINYVRKLYPTHRMIGVGTSLGGMVLSKYLIKHPQEAKTNFETAIIISIAWDCDAGMKNLEDSVINNYLINYSLTASLKSLAKKFADSIPEIPATIDIEGVKRATSVRHFDAAVTAPLFGYPSVAAYYKDASTKGHTHKFSIPVFALSAEDDPMSPGRYLPIDEAEAKGSNLGLVVTSRGGHLGFLEGNLKKEKHFMERFIGELVLAIRDYGEKELIM